MPKQSGDADYLQDLEKRVRTLSQEVTACHWQIEKLEAENSELRKQSSATELRGSELARGNHQDLKLAGGGTVIDKAAEVNLISDELRALALLAPPLVPTLKELGTTEGLEHSPVLRQSLI